MRYRDVIYFLLTFLVLFVLSCAEEEIDREVNPDVHTLDVVDVDEEGVTLRGEIRARGSDPILAYGFVWSENPSPEVTNATVWRESGSPDSDIFSWRITSALKQGETYFFRAFVVTGNYTIYGESRSFASLGSGVPEINSFSPPRGSWGDTLRVSGFKFGVEAGLNQGFVGDIKLALAETTDTLLTFVIPYEVNDEKVPVSIVQFGNRIVAEDSFSYEKPVILGVDKPEVAFGDTVLITAESVYPNNTTVSFNENQAQILALDERSVSVVVPGFVGLRSLAIRMTTNGLEDTYESISILDPESLILMDESAGYGDTVRIAGRYMSPDKDYVSVHFGGVEGEIVEASVDQVLVRVPNGLFEEVTEVTYKTGAFSATVGTFTLFPPVLTEIVPSVIHSISEQVTLKGRNFNTDPNITRLEVTYKNLLYVISRENIHSITPDEIKFDCSPIFRSDLVSRNGTIEVRVRTYSFDTQRLSFSIDYRGPWTRKQSFPGAGRKEAVAFSIGNYGYFGTGHWNGNEYNDFWKYDVNNDQWTRVSDFPGLPRSGASAFVLNGRGYVGLGTDVQFATKLNETRDHMKDFYSYDPVTDSWSSEPSIPGLERHQAASFSINGEGYIIGGHIGYLGNSLWVASDSWKFNPATNQWSEIQNFPRETYRGMGFSIGNTGYVYDYDQLHEFDGTGWIEREGGQLQTEEGISFTIGSDGYYGFGKGFSFYGGRQLVRYSGNNDFTDIYGDFISRFSGASVFVINNKAYVIGYADNGGMQFWEFDPSLLE